MANRRRELAARLCDAALSAPGDLDPATRAALYSRAASLSVQGRPPPTQPPAALHALADKVALSSFRVTDEDVAALHAAGFSEDAIYELVVSAALGAGMARLERALAALDGGAA